MSSNTNQNAPTFVWSRADIRAADATGEAIKAHLTRHLPDVAQMLSRDDYGDLAAVAVRAGRAAYTPKQVERESVVDALENDRCGACGSPAHFVEDCPTRAILAEVADERREQDKQWGEQNHPQADPVILARLATGTHPGDVARRLAEEYEVPTAVRARFICENEKPTTWFGIALEEFCEVLDAIATSNPARAREEWIQLSAVSAAAAESLDRNEGRQVGKGEQG